MFDKDHDDLTKGKCCKRITYQQFPETKSLNGLLSATSKNSKNSKKSSKTKLSKPCKSGCDNNPITAPSKSNKSLNKEKHSTLTNSNYCLEIYVPYESRWRICHSSQDKIIKLHTKLIYHIANWKLKNNASAIEKVMENSLVGKPQEISQTWNWENQLTWGNFCSKKMMQSPINIISKDADYLNSPKTPIDTPPNTAKTILYHSLNPVHTLIKRNGLEVIVTFTNFAGVIQIVVDNTYLAFTPVYMSFRFPGEHLIDGKRPFGEILIHCSEMSKQRKTVTSNGLVLTIPIEASKEQLDLKEFEALNMDFWKYLIGKHGSFTPKKIFKKKLLKFDLPNIVKKVTDLKSDYYLYYGTQTSPPCLENTYHLVATKAIKVGACQWKLLRMNTLLTNKLRTLHARVEQDMNHRVVYKVESTEFKYGQHVPVPLNYNKYLLWHPPRPTKRKALDCELPE